MNCLFCCIIYTGNHALSDEEAALTRIDRHALTLNKSNLHIVIDADTGECEDEDGDSHEDDNISNNNEGEEEEIVHHNEELQDENEADSEGDEDTSENTQLAPQNNPVFLIKVDSDLTLKTIMDSYYEIIDNSNDTNSNQRRTNPIIMHIGIGDVTDTDILRAAAMGARVLTYGVKIPTNSHPRRSHSKKQVYFQDQEQIIEYSKIQDIIDHFRIH